MKARNFAIMGVGGFVAPRHLKAIYETGNRVVAAADPNDSVGILDNFGFDIRFFREIERFDRHLDKLRRGPADGRVQYVSICSPNYLHDAHARIALRNGADAICEKPLVINPWNLDALESLEAETSKRIYTILQLRVHPDLVALREDLLSGVDGRRRRVELTYVTSRGPWYDVSWKGSEQHSGGVAVNIGIHFFDLLLWLFGDMEAAEIFHRDSRCYSGTLTLARADVSWFLSVDPSDLPVRNQKGDSHTYRLIRVDDEEIEFSETFTDLHTRVYEKCLRGEGFSIADARPSIELVHRLRTAPVATAGESMHHLLAVRNGGR
jgi:UDP-N-acetyl-2-amino-2-deoxyglucuronate dehydrogenase